MSLSFIKNLLTGILLYTVKYVMQNFAFITQWFSSFHNVWKIIVMGTAIFYFYFLSCASFFYTPCLFLPAFHPPFFTSFYNWKNCWSVTYLFYVCKICGSDPSATSALLIDIFIVLCSPSQKLLNYEFLTMTTYPSILLFIHSLYPVSLDTVWSFISYLSDGKPAK